MMVSLWTLPDFMSRLDCDAVFTAEWGGEVGGGNCSGPLTCQSLIANRHISILISRVSVNTTSTDRVSATRWVPDPNRPRRRAFFENWPTGTLSTVQQGRCSLYPHQYFYRVSTINKANYFLAQRHQTATICCNFRQRFKRQLRVCLRLCLPPHLRNAHT